MNVLNTEDMDNGTVILTLEMTKVENDLLIEFAIVELLRRYIKEQEDVAKGK